MNFGQAKAGELVETFLDCNVQIAPVLGESVDDTVSQHNHEGMAPSARLSSYVDGPHLEMHGLTVAKGPLDEGEILIAVMDNVFGSYDWGEISFQYVATIEFACFRQRIGIFCNRNSTPF